MTLFTPNHGILTGDSSHLTVYSGSQKAYAVWHDSNIIWPLPTSANRVTVSATGYVNLPDSYAYCIIALGGGGGGGFGGTAGHGEGGRKGSFTSHVFIRGFDDAYLGTNRLYVTLGAAGAGGGYAANGTAGGTTTVRADSPSGALMLSASGGAGGAQQSNAFQQNGQPAGSYVDPDFMVSITSTGAGTGNGGNATQVGCGGAGGNQQFLGANTGGNGYRGEVDIFYL